LRKSFHNGSLNQIIELCASFQGCTIPNSFL